MSRLALINNSLGWWRGLISSWKLWMRVVILREVVIATSTQQHLHWARRQQLSWRISSICNKPTAERNFKTSRKESFNYKKSYKKQNPQRINSNSNITSSNYPCKKDYSKYSNRAIRRKSAISDNCEQWNKDLWVRSKRL